MLEGIMLACFRSFGPEPQFLAPLERVNLLVGQNNAGKSNILRFLANNLQSAKANPGSTGVEALTPVDVHIGSTTRAHRFAIGVVPGGSLEEHLISKMNRPNEVLLKRLLATPLFKKETPVAWIEPRSVPDAMPHPELKTRFLSQPGFQTDEAWREIWSEVTGGTGGNLHDWIKGTLFHLNNCAMATIRDAVLIPAVRSVSAEKNVEKDFSGRGVVDRLARLQNPGYGHGAERKRFEQVNYFLQSVLGTSNANLEIPYDRDEILTHVDGKTLPLAALGTGIHEVVVIAAAGTYLQDQIVCIEEPEIHLHPVLQRKLLDYLATETKNQYFIATHSAHLLDAPEAAVWHVRLVDGASRVALATSSSEKASVAIDLGYRPSDLLQANSVIWVEGPSDRLYIRHWLAAVRPELIEGIHFSIMFYGGRLLSNLTAMDPEIDEFISLRRINRSMVVVMDSDREKKGGRLNATKLRIIREYAESSNPGHVWVTAGREIENYVPHELLRPAVASVHPSFMELPVAGKYGRALAFRAKGNQRGKADKLKVAHRVVEGVPALDVLDLRKQIQLLADFISAANH